jgi:hypothetical protein
MIAKLLIKDPSQHPIANRACVLCEIIYYGMALYGLILVGQWALDRQPPRVIFNGEITPKVATPGTLMHVQWEVQKRRDCEGTVIRFLSGMCGEHLIKKTEPVDLKTFENRHTVILPFTLPTTTTPGQCQYNTHLHFVCNPIQHIFPIEMELKPLDFQVVPQHHP